MRYAERLDVGGEFLWLHPQILNRFNNSNWKCFCCCIWFNCSSLGARLCAPFWLWRAHLPRISVRPDEAEAAVARLREMNPEVARAVVPAIPPEWEVSPAAKDALMELLWRRAGLVADRILGQLPFGLAA